MLVYKCDPEKNVNCRKSSCYATGGVCNHTTDRLFAIDPNIVQLVIPMSKEEFYSLFEEANNEQEI